MLAVAGIGASASPTPPPAPTAQPVALADSRPAVAMFPTEEELAALREEREASLLRAARAAARPATPVAPPVAPPPAAPVLPATTPAYTTQSVNLRAASSEDSAVVGRLEAGAEIAVTGTAAGGYVEIVHGGAIAWVWAEYVAATRPTAEAKIEEAPAPDGVSGAPCASGSGVESGLVSNAIAVHRAVCALFPQVSSYGGLRPGDSGEHGSGRALDIMISSDVGTDIATYLQAHAGELGVTELIWRQRIWTSDRAGDGWRSMEDRGSSTANHFDHVHVTVR